MAEFVTTVAGYVADLGIDVGKDYIKGKYDKKKLRESLISYIEEQRNYNEVCSLAEEIDFQGLIEYIRNNLLDDVNKRISCVKAEDRQAARQSIVDKAVVFSKASTSEAKKRVGKNIAFCLDIIKEFYKKQIDVQHYILVTEVVDAVNENTNQAVVAVKNEIKELYEQSTKDPGSGIMNTCPHITHFMELPM